MICEAVNLISYDTKDAANGVKRILERKGKGTRQVIKCDTCGKYHVMRKRPRASPTGIIPTKRHVQL
jgi:hypothetical protein